MARPSTASRRYAEAAFQLAERDDALDAWADGLDLAARLVSDERLARAVDNPAKPLEARLTIIGRLLEGRAPEGVTRLAGLLAERGRIDRLPDVAAEYQRLLDAARGIVEARVTSAAPLSADESAAVQAWVGKRTGKDVTLTTSVDEALIGGLTVRVGDTLLDASVRGRLERLRTQLLTGARAR
ncbi:MAG TPA: F0F1 ATP synthase subunit delta [Candidatus Limnocylindrales bacterium]|nr:F0F1 ATP synthase subunit delta [Candidatus Limnocylindrales bacterium]